MSSERVVLDTKLPFNYTVAFYTHTYNRVASEALCNTDNSWNNSLQREEEILRGFYANLGRGEDVAEEQKAEVEDSQPISFWTMLSNGKEIYVPLALPIQYFEKNKQGFERGPNYAMTYMSDDKLSGKDLARKTGVSGQYVSKQIQTGIQEMLSLGPFNLIDPKSLTYGK